MYKLEEMRERIKAGTWTKEDTVSCIREWKQMQDLTAYTEEIYAVCYGVFAYNFQEYADSLIEICRETGFRLERSKEKARMYLALVRLYFCLGFPPKIVEYGLKYANSGFYVRNSLKSVYNTIAAAFTDCGLFQEADIYLEKMMDISRMDPCDSDVNFWDSDRLNELVYYDSKIYVSLGMGDVAGAEQAARDMQTVLEQKEIPEDGRAFFLLQKEFSELYLRLHQYKDKAAIAEEFNAYMKKIEAGEGARDTLSYCVNHFAEFLQVMAEEERWDDIIRIGDYIRNARNFSGSFCPVYRLMREAASRSDKEEIRGKVPEYEKLYLETLEKEKENYTQMVRLLAKEELRIERMKNDMEKDMLTDCLNRAAFDRNSRRFIRNHQKGSLVFIDLDYLKEINDSYGHENGDQYLIHFSSNVKRVIDKHDILYRYAGDEFLILSTLGAEEIGKQLNEILETKPIRFQINGETRRISFSYGVVAFEEKDGDITELVKEADHRMYLCKSRNHRRISERGTAE